MKKNSYLFLFILVLGILFNSCDDGGSVPSESVEAATIQNPILSGFYPDPSICQVGNDYYLINSSFAYFPGLPIFHSNDLVNWEQIGHVLDRNEQLQLDSQGITRGLFAPAISYHDGTFYVICTNIDHKGNFVVTATDPRGPWSDPVWTPEMQGIDPSIYFEEDGSAYIVFNSGPPNGESLYSGHRTIRIVDFDKDELKVTSEPEIIVDGGSDISQEPIWIEAPHIYKINDWYYLMCAEGGTSWGHSEVVFRSKSVKGPYEPYEDNPILTQRHLDPNRANPVGCAGHADMVQAPDGSWWAVFLATRPYEGLHFNIGRETFIAPVEWINDWPVINPDFDEIQFSYPGPASPMVTEATRPHNGHYTLRDDFNDLHMSWVFVRNPREDWYRISDGYLEIDVRPETIKGRGNPSFVGRRQKYHYGEVKTKMSFNPAGPSEQAGLLLVQNERHHYFLCKELSDGEPVVSLYQINRGEESLLQSAPLPSEDSDLILQATSRGSKLEFLYGTEDDIKSLITDVDATILSTESAGGFVGIVHGPYATSNGVESDNKARFDWFEEKAADKVYD